MDTQVLFVEPSLNTLVELVEDNIYKWHIKLFGFDPTTQIAEDLFLYESVRPGRDHVLVEVIFPKYVVHLQHFHHQQLSQHATFYACGLSSISSIYWTHNSW